MLTETRHITTTPMALTPPTYKGDGIAFRFTATDPTDTTADGMRRVVATVSHAKKRGVVLTLRPVRYTPPMPPSGFMSESFLLFSPEPRDRPHTILLEARARRSDKVTAWYAERFAAEITELAIAYCANPSLVTGPTVDAIGLLREAMERDA